MVPSRREDDIALVAVRLHPQGDHPSSPASPAGRNRLVRAEEASFSVKAL